jgi:hypothetical protein
MFAGLDIGGKRTTVCVIDDSGKLVWRGIVDTHLEMIDAALQRFKGALDKVGLESGPFTPSTPVARSNGLSDDLHGARRAADAIKSRRIKSDKGDVGAGGDVADGLVFLGLRQVGRHASVEGAVGRAGSVGEAQALSGQSGARPSWPRSKGSRRGWTTNSTSLPSAMKSPGG